MKVTLVGPYPAPGKPISGGVERVIDTLLCELPRYAEVSLIVPNAAEDKQGKVAGVPIIWIKGSMLPGTLSYWTIDAIRVRKAVETLDPDIVHYQGVAGVSRGTLRPSILTIHGIAHHDILYKQNNSVLRRGALQASALLLKHVEQRYRHMIGNLVVINPYVEFMLPDISRLTKFNIPNPIDPIYVETPISLLDRPRKIVSVGRIGARKRTTHAVEVIARVLARDLEAEATFLGDPESTAYMATCHAIAAYHGVSERIHFPGNVDTGELCQYLDQASVFMMASQQETAPVAISEAQARGVAVIAPEAFGIPHMILSGQNGFFLPPRDLEAQVDLLIRALDYPWNRAEIASQARETYGPQNIAIQTIEAYKTVLGYE